MPLLYHLLVAQWIEYGNVAIDGHQEQVEYGRRTACDVQCYVELAEEHAPDPYAEYVLDGCGQHHTEGDGEIGYGQTEQYIVGGVL